MIKQPELTRQRPPIRGWLVVAVFFLGLRIMTGLIAIPDTGEYLTILDFAFDPVFYTYASILLFALVGSIALGIAALAGLLRGDRRFRKFYAWQVVLQLVKPLLGLLLYGGPANYGRLLIIVLLDGSALLYFYKSRRVREGYFPETKEDTSDDQTT
ncbi:MAG: hypothetical protein LBN04_04220 [Oscillospiraceae bacterium]|jgi:hypothetical protein|nr:hypothetical protein [Oscillospiraceae bacterium]